MTIEQLFSAAENAKKAGRPGEAEVFYRQILARQPDHISAGNNLGVLLADMGRLFEAITVYRDSINLHPHIPELYYNLGNALRAQVRRDEAIPIYEIAVKLRPNYFDALNNLGNELLADGKAQEAVTILQKAADLRPNSESLRNLGNALRSAGRSDDAIAVYGQAIALQGNSAEVWHEMGLILHSLGRSEEAVDAYRRAIAIKPEDPFLQNNFGIALAWQGKNEQAIASYQAALARKPQYPEALNNLGNALAEMHWSDQAIDCFQKAIALRSDYAAAHNNLGNALIRIGRVREGVRCLMATMAAPSQIASNRLYSLHYLDTLPDQLFQEHRQWNDRFAEPLRKSIRPHDNDRSPDRVLRIGYVSPDLREHSVAWFMESLLAFHDRQQVEVFCYADLARPDTVSRRFQSLVPHWIVTIGCDNTAVSEMIRKDRIDILIDLAGHGNGNRLQLFALKPAPVQVSYLGYPDTTGMAAMDYRLTDAYADPPGLTECYHSEKLIRLPRTFLCYRPPQDSPPPAPPPAITEGSITFGSFNSLAKISEGAIELWAKILKRVAGSRLLLKNRDLADAAAQRIIAGAFAAHGITADRLDLRAWAASTAEHLRAYNRVDIALDTFPYNGTTTTCEALWMGVPVVALAGRTHVSRVGVSILSNVGLPELIGQTPDQYVQIAADLAGDLARLKQLHTDLRPRMSASPLLDGPGFTRETEAVYRGVWRDWCAGGPA